MSNLPTHLRLVESSDNPGGQEQTKDPLVLVQNPRSHMSGKRSHSFISAKKNKTNYKPNQIYNLSKTAFVNIWLYKC